MQLSRQKHRKASVCRSFLWGNHVFSVFLFFIIIIVYLYMNLQEEAVEYSHIQSNHLFRTPWQPLDDPNRHRRPSWTRGSPTSHLKAWLFNACVGVHGKCARIAGQDLREADGASDSDFRGWKVSLKMEKNITIFSRILSLSFLVLPKQKIYGHLRTSYDIQIWNKMDKYIYIERVYYTSWSRSNIVYI